MRQANTSRIELIAWAGDAEHRLHDKGIVGGVRAIAKIDIDERGGMTTEPAGLEADSASFDGPLCSICGHGHTAAYRCHLDVLYSINSGNVHG